MLVDRGSSGISSPVKEAELIKRPQISYEDVMAFDADAPELSYEVKEQAALIIEYEGYIKRQIEDIDRLRALEEKLLPEGTDYRDVRGLSLEAIEKLNKIRPSNIGEASRISGVSPADVTVLVIWLAGKKNDSRKN